LGEFGIFFEYSTGCFQTARKGEISMSLQQVGVWGNNLAIRIPKNVDLFRKGDRVELVQTNEGLLITPAKRSRRSMAEILKTEDGVFRGELADFGQAAGEEFDL
jgi:antitoxin component of MazEF toxin-antitoxin module